MSGDALPPGIAGYRYPAVTRTRLRITGGDPGALQAGAQAPAGAARLAWNGAGGHASRRVIRRAAASNTAAGQAMRTSMDRAGESRSGRGCRDTA